MPQPKTKTPRPILAPNEVFWGERLQLAREFRGLTQENLAVAVAASPTLVRYCEYGKKRDPATDLVEAFGAVLGFEPEFFYGPVQDVFRDEECSFRHRRTTPQKTKTQIRAHATLIAMVVEKLRGTFRFPKLNVPSLPASSPEEIEDAAEQCRIHWNLGVGGPLLQVGRAAEHAGIFVVPHLAQSEKVDAFSRRGKTTIIFLNQAIKSTSRWNFDIAHECGHIVMHQKIVTGDIETEAAADRFASAFLMPRRAFEREFCSKTFSWNFIFELKHRWQTSAAAIIRRAYDLHLIDAVAYRRAYQYMSAQGWRTNGEPNEPAFQQPELLDMALSSLGKKVDLTMEELRSELHFKAETFQEVTGMALPATPRPKKGRGYPVQTEIGFGGRLAGARAGLINRRFLPRNGVRFTRPPFRSIVPRFVNLAVASLVASPRRGSCAWLLSGGITRSLALRSVLPPFAPRVAAGDSSSRSSARCTAAVSNSYARCDARSGRVVGAEYVVRFAYHLAQCAEIVLFACHEQTVAPQEAIATACCLAATQL